MRPSKKNDFNYLLADPSIPFEMSWFDRFASTLDRSRISYWLAIGLLVSTCLGLIYLVSKLQPSPIQWSPALIYIFIQVFYFLLILKHLRNYSARTLQLSRRAILLEEDLYKEAEHRFTNTPQKSARWGTLLGGCFALLLIAGTVLRPDIAQEVSSTEFSLSLAGILLELVLLSIWILNGLLVAFIVHKLRMIDAIYTQWMEINPFQPRSLYNLANYTGRTAILWVLPSIPWILLDPGLFSLITVVVFLALGILIYILPLMGVHRVLEQMKAELLDQNGAQVQSTINDMNVHLMQEHLEDFAALDSVLSGLERSREAIERISTWPWQVDSFRRVIAALFLPLFIWLAQYFLGQLLGG